MVLKAELRYKNIKYVKMASNKNVQNSAPRDLKRKIVQ